jgi:hypothetical protein
VPGYFLSYALRGGDKVLGVATVKVNLEAAERAWASLPGEMLLTDERGVVILTSRPDWKFRALQPLSAQARAEVLAEKPYTADPPLLPWARPGTVLRTGQRVQVDGAEHLVTTRALPHQRWQMQALDPLAPAHAKARNQAWMAGLASGRGLPAGHGGLAEPARRDAKAGHAGRAAGRARHAGNPRGRAHAATEQRQRLAGAEVETARRWNRACATPSRNWCTRPRWPCWGRSRPAWRTNSTSRWRRCARCRTTPWC